MAKKVACKRCGKPIRWKQNEAGKWIPYQPIKDQIHWEVCKGEPETDTPLALKTKIEQLESDLHVARATIFGLKDRLAQAERQLKTSEAHATYLNTNMSLVQLINTAKAWHRSYDKQTGRTELHKKRVLAAIARFIDDEKKQSEKSKGAEKKS